MLRIIDAHAHLDGIEDVDSALADAAKAGVVAVIAVGTGYDSNQRVLEIAHRHKKLVYPALGLHPGYLGQMKSTDIERTLQQIEDNRGETVAIGEVGLDYDKKVVALAAKERQQAVFGELMALARKYQQPVIIHSRYSWQDALDMAKAAGVETAVFHWFTGPSSILRDIIAQGYSISATPATEYHAEHRRAVKEAPLSGLLLETDSPVEYGRELRYTAFPKDVLRTLRAVADLRDMEEATLAEQTTQNALRFFQQSISL